jgi:hypothetical protein
MVEDERAAAVQMFAEAQRRRRFFKKTLQAVAAAGERKRAEVFAVELQKIERVLTGEGCRAEQGVEIGEAFGTMPDDFAIDGQGPGGKVDKDAGD